MLCYECSRKILLLQTLHDSIYNTWLCSSWSSSTGRWVVSATNESTAKQPDLLPQASTEDIQEYNETLNALALPPHHLKVEKDKAVNIFNITTNPFTWYLRHPDSIRTGSEFTKWLFNTKEPTYTELYALINYFSWQSSIRYWSNSSSRDRNISR